MIGAPGSNKVYVVFGQTLNGTGTLDLDKMTATQGFVIQDGTGQAGSSVAVADLDGDGIADVLIGAPNANPVAPAGDPQNVRGFGGQVYVVFGARDIGKSGPIDLATLNGSNGTVLVGQHFVVPSDAPIPDAVPMMPCAKLKRPVPLVRSAMTSGVSTPSTAPLMPSSN